MKKYISDKKDEGLEKMVTDNMSHAFPAQDQRDIPRWRMDNTAFYRTHDTTVINKTEVKNLSLTGVCLYVGKDIGIGQELEVKVYLSDKVSFKAAGDVIWKRMLSDGSLCAGIRFDQIPLETQILIVEHYSDSDEVFNFSHN